MKLIRQHNINRHAAGIRVSARLPETRMPVLEKPDTKTASIIRIGIEGEWHETLDLVRRA